MGVIPPIPYPIVLLTAKDEEKIGNITTLIWIGTFSQEPFIIGVAVKKKRYSYGLVKKSGVFGINIPGEDHLVDADYCGYTKGSSVDKFKETSFTPVDGKVIDAPMIKECPVRLECKLLEIKELGDHDLIIGEVVHTEIDPSVCDENGRIDLLKLKPIIANYPQGTYHMVGERIGFWGMSMAGGKDV